jgi:hypothetical protein
LWRKNSVENINKKMALFETLSKGHTTFVRTIFYVPIIFVLITCVLLILF